MKNKLIIKLSTGYKVKITENDYEWISHLCRVILDETVRTLKDKNIKIWETFRDRFISEEIENVTGQLINLFPNADTKFWRLFITHIMYYAISLDLIALCRGIDLHDNGIEELKGTKEKFLKFKIY